MVIWASKWQNLVPNGGKSHPKGSIALRVQSSYHPLVSHETLDANGLSKDFYSSFWPILGCDFSPRLQTPMSRVLMAGISPNSVRLKIRLGRSHIVFCQLDLFRTEKVRLRAPVSHILMNKLSPALRRGQTVGTS